MTQISELSGLATEFLEITVNEEDDRWSTRALEIVHEIAEYARGTEMYKENYELGIERGFGNLNSGQLYWYIISLIANAPIFLYAQGTVLLLMPFLEAALAREALTE